MSKVRHGGDGHTCPEQFPCCGEVPVLIVASRARSPVAFRSSVPHLDAAKWVSFQTIPALNRTKHATKSAQPEKPSSSLTNTLDCFTVSPLPIPWSSALPHRWIAYSISDSHWPRSSVSYRIFRVAVPVVSLDTKLQAASTSRFRRPAKLSATIFSLNIYLPAPEPEYSLLKFSINNFQIRTHCDRTP